MFFTNNKRPAPDELISETAKRQLVDNLAQLSIDGGHHHVGVARRKIRPSELRNDYMDTSGPNTVFIPSIDEFLEEDDDDGEIYTNLPLSLLMAQPALKLPFYQRPSLSLIVYEPIELTIWRPFFKWKSLYDGGSMDVEMEPDTYDAYGDTMDIDYD